MNEFWNENLKIGYYDKIVKSGLNSKRGIQSFWHTTTLNNVSKFLKKDMLHLDYACGPGTLIGLYSEANSTGIDLSENQIIYANKNYGDKGNFYSLDNFDIQEHNTQYEIITILGLIEFLNHDEIKDLINKLEECLVAGGKIVLTTPNFGGFMKILEKLLNRFGSVDYSKEHVNKFNTSSLKKLNNNFMNFESEIFKFMNFSIFLSFFSHRFATFIEKIISKLFKNYFGALFMTILTKKG
tara:strand:- start:44 stop:763 length:720 start_codon:yes stop_codon:yes gene_type:complete